MRLDWFKKNKKSRMALLAIFFSGSAVAALYGGGPAELWTFMQIQLLQENNISKIEDFTSEFSEALNSAFSDITSAIAVATKQEALDATTISDAQRIASQQLVSAIQAQQIAATVAEVVANYDPAMGQGFDPCGTLAKNRTLDQAFTGIDAVAVNRTAQLDNGAGRLTASADAMGDRVREHRSKFCTSAEAKAGLCTESRLPAGDANAELFFRSAAPNSLETQARRAYIQNLLGDPDKKLNKDAGRSASGQHYFLAKTQKDSLQSIAAYSLSSIDAANTQVPSLDNQSPNDILTLRVNAYFGGDEAKDWAGTLASQTERGLLIEYAKMSGLGAWIHHNQYKQNERILLNLAGLVAANSATDKAQADEIYQRAVRQYAKGEMGQ
jgi:hypothetical protein